MSEPQSRARQRKDSSRTAALSVLLIAGVSIACNLTNRWREKKEAPPVRRCFAQSNGANATRSTSGTDNTPSAQQQTANMITSEDGGFTIKLPSGFPPPDPPEPIKRGYEYAGISYYSLLSGCRSRVNYTNLTAIASAGQSDEQVLAGRREMVSKELVNDAYRPVTIDKTEESSVQNHRALSVYVSGTGVGANDQQSEYRRSKFIVARGRLYTIEFAAEDKAELDHREVNEFFNSFQFTGELDGRVISKPEAEYPAIGRAMRAKGTVVVEVTVNTDGRVIDARAVTGPIVLQAAAIAAARKARFAPGSSEIKGTLTYNFTAP